MNIDEMQAGREMDAMIAEDVMGWEYKFVKLTGHNSIRVWTNKDYTGYDDDIPRFSTDIAAAWQVVEKVSELFFIRKVGAYYYSIQLIFNGASFVGEADTVPLAICRAALKAMEV